MALPAPGRAQAQGAPSIGKRNPLHEGRILIKKGKNVMPNEEVDQ